MADLLEFQKAAVDRIVERLKDPEGSRRFLLADEVGLGKTLIAKGVIDRLQAAGARGFTVVYICSNLEIADQNRDKLCADKNASALDRLTFLSLRSSQIERLRAEGKLQVFAMTPGTSLKVEQGTGTARERRLLMYLLWRTWRLPVRSVFYRRFFRCSARENNWEKQAKFFKIASEFSRMVSVDFQDQLRQQWGRQRVHLLDMATGHVAASDSPLRDALEHHVRHFVESGPKDICRWHSRNRTRLIGALRHGLAKVSLTFLKPDLIILDEFQRFSEIVTETASEGSLVGQMFRQGTGATLILSATPYKMFTLDHEREKHHESFLETLAFLRNEEVSSQGVQDVLKHFKSFRVQLDSQKWANGHDSELLATKQTLEDELKKIMCRTERNWYLEDAAKGMSEVFATEETPGSDELKEFIHLRRFLLKRRLDDWNITDFWKSCPSVLNFMDSQYSLTSRLKRQTTDIPKEVLQHESSIGQAGWDNLKFRSLFRLLFGDEGKRPKPSEWKFLWTRPSYTYHRDEFFKGQEPSKYLVFSHWRFVPKAIAILTSAEARRRLGLPRRKMISSPLQLRQKASFYVFDVCYPSPVLADCIHPITLATATESPPDVRDIFSTAREKVAQLVREAGIGIGKVRNIPLWRIVARLEGRSVYCDSIVKSLKAIEGRYSSEALEYFPAHARIYREWMADDSPLTISPRNLDRLTLIALSSPGVCTLRAARSVFPQATESLDPLFRFCFASLRQYFNKRLVQGVIRMWGEGNSYTENVLTYSRDAHLQATLDEYAYLVRNVLQEKTLPDYLAHVARAMGMWTGTPAVNGRTKGGSVSRRPVQQSAHFALAFGDDIAKDAGQLEDKARKTCVREAFNSPFWPFVLATTSVGQEGLDFHLYCRDIVHWNLPSNPVDLEQREGRINRYDALSIRRNIAKDHPLHIIRPADGVSWWSSLFQHVTTHARGSGRFKHGLFPHWVYQPRDPSRVSLDEAAIIRRHLLFYAGSKDRQQYESLKHALLLYRLALGQPRQQDLLDRVREGTSDLSSQDLGKLLSRYMVNLSPFTLGHARERSRDRARMMLDDEGTIQRMIDDCHVYFTRAPDGVKGQISSEFTELAELASSRVSDNDKRGRHRKATALAALIYLVDPFDAVYDFHGDVGFGDDIQVIRATHGELFPPPEESSRA